MSSMSATVRVEKATSDLLIGPDWTLNMDICDSINSDNGQSKDVVKAVKKCLQHKNPRVQFLALTLLEAMVKNCGEFVHFQVADRGILQEMIKIVRKKTDMQVREKILVLLDSWQEAFGGPGGKYLQYYWAYTELKRSGVDFPQRSPDSALIFTPPVTHAAAAPPRYLQLGYGMPSNSSVRLDEAMASEMANLSLSDLDRYRSVTELLSDMLKAVNPGDHEAVKDEVIADLVGQCRFNQKKLMQFVNSTEDEELLAQGLVLNDDLQSLLAKHDAIASGSPLPAEASDSVPEPTTPIAPTYTITNRSKEGDEEEDDDDFAQLARRNSKYKQTMVSSKHSDETNRSGVDFPQRSPDSALIFTPVTHSAAPPPRYLQIGYGMPSNSSVRLDEAMASEMANLSLSDLDRYRSVTELLSDMLKAVNPGDHEAVKDEVIADLVGQCRFNQKKLMQFVNSTEDEELLAQGLALNDDLQSLLAKHDAIASGSPLPAEASDSVPEPTTIAPTYTITNRSKEGDEEEEDDDFAQLARRNSKYKQTTASSNHSDETNATAGSTSEPSSSVGCNALALPDPPAPIKTSNDKEQDMIDLLSLTLSSNPSPPRTPLTPPSASFQNRSPSSISANRPTSPFTPQPQPYLVNQGYTPYNSYVAPWAQPQPQPWVQPQPQPQPWAQPQPQHWAHPQPQPWAQHQPQLQIRHQVPLSYPPPPWDAASSANSNPFMTNNAPMHTTQPQQQYNLFDPRVHDFPANNVQVSANLRQTGYGVSPNPYVHSDKLFDDLLDLRVTTDKSARTNTTSPMMSGSSGQNPIGGRK